VSVLLTAVALAVLQLGFVAHVRSVAIDSAIAGAAHAALADTEDAEGVTRASELVSDGIAATLVRRIDVEDLWVSDRPVVAVRITVGIPVIGPWFPVSEMTVTGRAFRETD
jgi:hypothetical protein